MAMEAKVLEQEYYPEATADWLMEYVRVKDNPSTETTQQRYSAALAIWRSMLTEVSGGKVKFDSVAKQTYKSLLRSAREMKLGPKAMAAVQRQVEKLKAEDANRARFSATGDSGRYAPAVPPAEDEASSGPAALPAQPEPSAPAKTMAEIGEQLAGEVVMNQEMEEIARVEEVAKKPGKVAPWFELEKNPLIALQTAIVQAGRKPSSVQLYAWGLGSFKHPTLGPVVMPYGFLSWDESATTLPNSGKNATFVWSAITAIACAEYEKTNAISNPLGNRARLSPEEAKLWSEYQLVPTPSQW